MIVEASVKLDSNFERTKFLLPIECDYLNKMARMTIMPSYTMFDEPSMSPGYSNTIDSLTGQSDNIKKHFNIVKMNKSTLQIEELKNRGNDFKTLIFIYY